MSHLNTLLQIMCYVHKKRSWAFLEMRACENPWNIFVKKWSLSNSSGFICLFLIRIKFSKDIVPGFFSKWPNCGFGQIYWRNTSWKTRSNIYQWCSFFAKILYPMKTSRNRMKPWCFQGAWFFCKTAPV